MFLVFICKQIISFQNIYFIHCEIKSTQHLCWIFIFNSILKMHFLMDIPSVNYI